MRIRPVRFGYAPNPWWKWEETGHVRSVVRRFVADRYPTDVDDHPPDSPGLAARWLRMWDLVPADTDDDGVAAEIERTLASLDIVAVPSETDGLRTTGATGERRLSAQWEPLDTVIIIWPMWYPGLWRFHRDLARAIEGAAPVTIVVRTAALGAAAVWWAGLDAARVRLVVTRVDDMWVRDYGPIVVQDGDGPTVIDAKYDPPPKMPTRRDDSFPTRWATAHGLSVQALDLYLEGGNLWSDGHGTVYTTTHNAARNPQLDPDQVNSLIAATLGAERLVQLPPLRRESTRHVDLICKPLSIDRMLVAEGAKENRRVGIEARDLLSRVRNSHGNRLDLVPLPSPDPYWNWGVVPVWPTYTNSLTVNGRIIVPTFGVAADDRALRTISEASDLDVHPVDARVAANGGGSVHCLTMQIPETTPPA